MSFILDALRKAESERNRHVAPVLMDARVAPPRRKLPAWAIGLGVVLLLNLGLLAWLLGRTPAPAATPPAGIAPAAVVSAEENTVQEPAAATPAVTPAPLPAPLATAQRPAAMAPPPASGPSLATTGDEERLPELRDLRNAGISLPDIQLNLHVYTPAPADRSVLLDGQRAREGDYLPNGVKVERITPTAVILEGAGRRFRLTVGE